MSVHLFRRKDPRPAPKHTGGPFPPEKQWQPGTLRALRGNPGQPAWYQEVPPAVPPGARPAEDIPVIRKPMRRPATRTAPRPHPAPEPGSHPFEQRPRGTRHTVPFTPDFAETSGLARPYAPRNTRPRTPDTWSRRAHPLTQQGRSADEFVQERMRDLDYPAPGAAPSEVARFMRRISVITGTRSTFEQPAQCTAWGHPRAPGAGIAVRSQPERPARPPALTRPQLVVNGGGRHVFTRKAAS